MVVVLRFFHPFPLCTYVFKQSLGQASDVLRLLLFGLLRKHSSRGRRHGGGPGRGWGARWRVESVPEFVQTAGWAAGGLMWQELVYSESLGPEPGSG